MLFEDPTRSLEEFRRLAGEEAGEESEKFSRWLFTDRKLARGQLTDMDFYGFQGAKHLSKFFNYIKNFKYPHYFDLGMLTPLQDTSAKIDLDVFSRLGLPDDEAAIRNIALYNAQDYLFQRAYATPARHVPVRMLDFGAGHGRMANLAFAAPNATVQKYFAVDGIPASYLTQNMYYSTLGLRVYEYLDRPHSPFDIATVESQFDVFHFPTWKMALLPSRYFDLICCVQVLRELSQGLLMWVLGEFARIIKPGGALYVRDHAIEHNPNQMPQDALLEAHGFQIEFYPRIIDFADVHGTPRIWRKFDERVFTKGGGQSER